jgi:Tol biopolymer transport system component
MKKLSHIFFLFVIALYSCSNQKSSEQSKNIFNSNTLISYVEAKTEKGNLSGEFGDIVILDYESGHKYKISDDDFYDSKPSLSPDKKQILFFTNRDRSSFQLKMNSAGYPFQLYVFDVATNKFFGIKKYFPNSTPVQFNELKNTDIDWFPDSLSFLLEYDNKLYRLFLDKHIVKQIYQVPNSNNRINAFNLSPNGNYIIVYLTNYDNNNISFKNNLHLLNLDDSTVKIIDSEILYEQGCWTDEGLYIYAKTKYGDNSKTDFISYNPFTNQKEQLSYPDSLDIFLVNKNYLIVKILDGESKEIYRYFPETKSFQELTKDGKQKSDISRN